MLGQHKDMQPILDAIEERGHKQFAAGDFEVTCADLMISVEPDQVSQVMWSWINLTLEKSTSAQRIFHNCPELDGAEVYPRLVAPLGKVKPSRTRRNMLRDRVQNPGKAKSFVNIKDAVAVWEADMLAFIKAGGTEPDNEDK